MTTGAAIDSGAWGAAAGTWRLNACAAAVGCAACVARCLGACASVESAVARWLIACATVESAACTGPGWAAGAIVESAACGARGLTACAAIASSARCRVGGAAVESGTGGAAARAAGSACAAGGFAAGRVRGLGACRACGLDSRAAVARAGAVCARRLGAAAGVARRLAAGTGIGAPRLRARWAGCPARAGVGVAARIRGSAGIGVCATAVRRGAVHAPDTGVGEAVGAEIELELLAEECGAVTGGGRLPGDVGRQLGAGLGHGLPGEAADGTACGLVGDLPDTALAEPAAHRTADGAADRGLDRLAEPELVHRAVALGHLDQPGTEVDAAFLQRALGPLQQGRPGNRLGGGARQHPLDQLADGHPDGYLRRHPRRRADPGAHTGERPGHLRRGDDHRGDDGQLRVLDVVGAVVEEFGLLLAVFDEALQRALLTRELLPRLTDRIVRLAGVDRGQDLADDLPGLVVQPAQGGRRARPPIGDAPHRRLVALGPITRAEHPFGNPLQAVRDFDPHQACTWFTESVCDCSDCCRVFAAVTILSPNAVTAPANFSMFAVPSVTPGV